MSIAGSGETRPGSVRASAGALLVRGCRSCSRPTIITLCTLLIPRFGGLGAAMSTATALIVESILLFFATRWRIGLHVFIWRR